MKVKKRTYFFLSLPDKSYAWRVSAEELAILAPMFPQLVPIISSSKKKPHESLL